MSEIRRDADRKTASAADMANSAAAMVGASHLAPASKPGDERPGERRQKRGALGRVYELARSTPTQSSLTPLSTT